MQPLRFGLLGTGYWALQAHGAALTASHHAVLYGVWGRDPAKARDVAQRLGASAYEDVDRLLAEVDAVAIAVPPDVQADLAVRAAQAGCHLLLDKPLALSVPAAEAVVGAVEKAGVASVIFFTSRFRPDVEAWTEEATRSGPWHSAHLVHYANIFQPGNPFSTSPWRREYGALWDVGPHALASVLPVMGPVTSVTARNGQAGSDTVHLVLSHGAHAVDELLPGPVSVSTLSMSLTMPPAATGTQLLLYGEPGTRTRPEGSFDAAEVFLIAIAELAAMVRNGEHRHRCDASFGLEVVRVLVAAEEARGLPGVELSY